MIRRGPVCRLASAIGVMALSLSSVPAAGADPPDPPGARALAIVGGTLLDGTGAPPIPSAAVVIRGGKIECAGRGCVVPKGAEVVDAKGMWITPGVVDAHVHFSQTGWADGRPDSIDVRDRYPYDRVSAGLKAHPERFFPLASLLGGHGRLRCGRLSVDRGHGAPPG